MAGREKGVETLPCQNCGTDRPVERQADGAATAPACPKCYPADVTPEVASAAPAARQVGTPNIVVEEV